MYKIFNSKNTRKSKKKVYYPSINVWYAYNVLLIRCFIKSIVLKVVGYLVVNTYLF